MPQERQRQLAIPESRTASSPPAGRPSPRQATPGPARAAPLPKPAGHPRPPHRARRPPPSTCAAPPLAVCSRPAGHASPARQSPTARSHRPNRLDRTPGGSNPTARSAACGGRKASAVLARQRRAPAPLTAGPPARWIRLDPNRPSRPEAEQSLLADRQPGPRRPDGQAAGNSSAAGGRRALPKAGMTSRFDVTAALASALLLSSRFTSAGGFRLAPPAEPPALV